MTTDDRIRELARDYNAPPRALDAARREEIWNRIQRERGASSPRTAHRIRPRHRNRLQTIAAVAAVLLIGILIGRTTVDRPDERQATTSDHATANVDRVTTTNDHPVTPGNGLGTPGERLSADDTPSPDATHRLATRDYLLRTETLLTEFRLAAASPTPESALPGTGPWASSLLLETRLLMDSAIGENPDLQRLLRDLELILAEIVQLADAADERERQEIRRSLEERGVLLRLRRAVPAKAGTRGA
ncbi:MAG TPA: hypothetical protein VKA86_02855 [Candidatus Krumholzibacteria bacterium]|nr:hypothetical protein [Candidatus Krumholzibacteria bacterium]